MKKILSLFLVVFLLVCGHADQKAKITSPDGDIELDFSLLNDGSPAYTVKYKHIVQIDTSTIGFDFLDLPPLQKSLEINKTLSHYVSDKWELPWGEQRIVENEYNQLRLELQETSFPYRQMDIVFRVYNDGLGFRCEFPEQESMKNVVLMDEHTEFNLNADHLCWWIPGDWDIYEHLYKTTPLSQINVIPYRSHVNLAQTYIPENAVNTPVTMKTNNGTYLSFHEANLTNYAGMTLKVDTVNYNLVSELVGSADSSKVKTKVPFTTPWRTIQIADKAGDLIESNLILNLNEPNQLGRIPWFKPSKYVGIWWEMHIGKSSWDMASGKHGATTRNAKYYIDFAAENNIGAVLVEGWNTGWENWFGIENREGVFDFISPYPDYDLEEVVRYAKEKNVQIIMHHETSAAPRAYETQMDTAFQLCQRLGIHMIKTGYVGKIIPKGEYHHGQWMVNHYRKVLEKAATYQLAINAHEPIKATGIRRTLPNAVSREGLRGQEFNAWGTPGNPPEHLTIVPFTRMLAGPIDFTPGIFDLKFNQYKPDNQVNTTLTKQLALYVVIYSPIQMAADLPENYRGHETFQFIRDVAVDWEKTIVLNGEIGDYVTIVRKERNSDNWFLGSITDENARTFVVSLSFLDPGRNYIATIYQDAADAHWDRNPSAIDINKFIVSGESRLKLNLAEGGGTAISIIPAVARDEKSYPVYPNMD